MAVQPKNILVVDDDPGMLRLLVKWLSASGYHVRHAEDGRRALEMIESECPEILLTDWEMPGLNGLQLIQWLRNHTWPHYVYTVALTIRCGKADILSLYEAGTDDYLKKPIDKDELVARLMSGARMIELMSHFQAQPGPSKYPVIDSPELRRQVCEHYEGSIARDLLTPATIQLPAETPLRKVLQFISHSDKSEWPVVNTSGTLVGMIHEQDIASALLHENAWDKPLRMFVRQDHPRFTEQTTALEIYGYFCRHATTSVPIMREGMLLGIVPRREILMQLTQPVVEQVVPLANMLITNYQPVATANLIKS